MSDKAIMDGREVQISEVPPERWDDTFCCPECGKAVTINRGNYRTQPFFHHARNTKAEGCSMYQPPNKKNPVESERRYTRIFESTGESYEGYTESDEKPHKESKWHKRWKQKFPRESWEQINRSPMMKSGKIFRRADVMLHSLVLEFQYSDINQAEYWSRTADWKDAGYRIVWVVNYTKAEKNGESVFENIESCDFLQLAAIHGDLIQEYLVFDCGSKGVVILSDFEKTEDGIKARKKQITSKEGFIQIAHFLGNQEVVPDVVSIPAEPKEVITVPKLESGGCYAYRYESNVDKSITVYYLSRLFDTSHSYYLVGKYKNSRTKYDKWARCENPELCDKIINEIRENGLAKITVANADSVMCCVTGVEI